MEDAELGLPGDPRTFWSAGADLERLEPPEKRETIPTLERLGPSPFPRSGFPLIGFLATVYEHVADRAPRAFSDPYSDH